MRDIVKQIEEKIVHRNNTLRFELDSEMELVIKNTTQLKAIKFLKLTMDLKFKACQEIFKRVNSGESFTTVTNDLNVRGLL